MKLGADELACRQAIRNIEQLIDWDGFIRRKQKAAFQRFLSHADPRVRAYAEEIAARDVQLRQQRAQENEEWETTPLVGDTEQRDFGKHPFDTGTEDTELPF